jgi:anti-anti-sigma factor
MAMKTSVKRQGDTVIVSMDGKMDFEIQDEIKSSLAKIVAPNKRDEAPKRIIMNLEKLEFVGASGISTFVQTLKDIGKEAAEPPRYCGVKSEFKRMMRAFDEEQSFQFFDNEERARKSYDN